MAPSPVALNGAELSVPDVEAVARGERYAVLADSAGDPLGVLFRSLDLPWQPYVLSWPSWWSRIKAPSARRFH